MWQGSDEKGRSELRLRRWNGIGTSGQLQRATILPGNYNHMEVWANFLSCEPKYATSGLLFGTLNLKPRHPRMR